MLVGLDLQRRVRVDRPAAHHARPQPNAEQASQARDGKGANWQFANPVRIADPTHQQAVFLGAHLGEMLAEPIHQDPAAVGGEQRHGRRDCTSPSQVNRFSHYGEFGISFRFPTERAGK